MKKIFILKKSYYYRGILCIIILFSKLNTCTNPGAPNTKLNPKLLETYTPTSPLNHEFLIPSSNGHILALIEKNILRVFNTKKENLIFEKEMDEEIDRIRLTQSGKYLLVLYGINKIAIYNIAHKKKLFDYKHETFIFSVYLSKNGKYSVSLSTNTIKAYDIKNKKLLFKKILDPRMGPFDNLYITNNGKYIAMIAKGSWIKIFTTTPHTPHKKNKENMIFNYQFYNLIDHITISEDGQYFAASLQKHKSLPKNDSKIISEICVGNISTKNFNFYSHNHSENFLDFTPDGKFLISGSLNGNFKIYCNHKKKVLHNIQTKENSSYMGLSSDYKKLILHTKSNIIKKYQAPLILYLTYEAYKKNKKNKKNIKTMQNNLYKTQNKKLHDLIIYTKA